MDNNVDRWRQDARKPSYVDPEPQAGLVFADSQAHTLSQRDSAAWVREYFGLIAHARYVDDAVASRTAFTEHLTPLCQLAGVVQVGANLLRLGEARLASMALDLSADEPISVQPWLFSLTAQRRADVSGQEQSFSGTPNDLWDALSDIARCEDIVGDPDSPTLVYSENDAVLTLAGLFKAAAEDAAGSVAALIDDDLSWSRVSAVMFETLALTAWGVGNMFVEPKLTMTQAIEMSANDPTPVLDVAEILRRQRPEIDLGKFFSEG